MGHGAAGYHAARMTSVPTIEPTTQVQASRPRASHWRLLLLVAGLLAGLALIYLTPIRPWLQDTQRVRAALRDLGLWSYPACVLAVAVLVTCGIPRLLFCALGGMLLGFWWGLILTQAGTLLGCYAVFLFVRWGGRHWVLHRWPGLGKWAQRAREHGLVGVILVRQLPVHGTILNLCLGLSHVKHRHFLLGTAIGLIPEAIPVTLVGAGLVQRSFKESAGYMGIAAAAFILIFAGAGYALRSLRRRNELPDG